MKAAGWGLLVAAAGMFMPVAGCYVPKSQVVNYETTNRVLAAQNSAQLVEINNLRDHARRTEDQLIRAEQEFAVRDQADPHRPQLAGDPAPRSFLTAAACPRPSASSSWAGPGNIPI